MEIIEEIKGFIATELAPDAGAFGPDDDLLAAGVIDSLGILRLVDFLEEKFGVKAQDDDLIPENFESLNVMRAFVEQKMKG